MKIQHYINTKIQGRSWAYVERMIRARYDDVVLSYNAGRVLTFTVGGESVVIWDGAFNSYKVL